MWTLFLVILFLWMLTEIILNIIKIFVNIKEAIKDRRFAKNLHDNILEQLDEFNKEE